jgi:hypothetical protein
MEGYTHRRAVLRDLTSHSRRGRIVLMRLGYASVLPPPPPLPSCLASQKQFPALSFIHFYPLPCLGERRWAVNAGITDVVKKEAFL